MANTIPSCEPCAPRTIISAMAFAKPLLDTASPNPMPPAISMYSGISTASSTESRCTAFKTTQTPPAASAKSARSATFSMESTITARSNNAANHPRQVSNFRPCRGGVDLGTSDMKSKSSCTSGSTANSLKASKSSTSPGCSDSLKTAPCGSEKVGVKCMPVPEVTSVPAPARRGLRAAKQVAMVYACGGCRPTKLEPWLTVASNKLR
mmetsp:Transcript_130061/g.324220  ORF Transcript_130061/g.324220 Transcript_130061/m.324220 type:complete len:208 (+) Transcript_130061:610-1233(+)